MKTAYKSLVVLMMFIFSLTSCTHDNDPICVDDGTGGTPEYSTDELLVKSFSEAPVFDGIVDDVWSEARPLKSTASVTSAGNRIITLNSSSKGDTSLEPNDLMDPFTGEAYNFTLRGGHDNEYLYLLFEWEDDTDSKDRQSWYFDPVDSKWKQENKYANHKNDKFYEDKFGFMFPIGNPEGFDTGTCTVTCHRNLTNPQPGEKVTRHYMKNEGELTDFWHWKRDRHALAEACDDGYVRDGDGKQGTAAANGRKNDEGISPYSTAMKFVDETTMLVGPKYIIPNRDNYYWITEDEIDNGTAKAVTAVAVNGVLTYKDGSVSKTIDPNDDPDYSQGFGKRRMPSVIINPGGGPDDPRGEVQVQAIHTGSGWQLELRRKLVTGDPKDRAFAIGEEIPFGLAIFGNAAIGHGMTNFLSMKIEQ